MKMWLPTAGDRCVADLWWYTEHSAIDLYIVALTASQTAVVKGGGGDRSNKAKEKIC